jgi:hypothetical protein
MSTLEAIETEAGFQAWIVQYAQWHGWRVYHSWLSVHSTPGFPDLVLCRGERLIFAEIKSLAGKVTAHQREWLDALAQGPGVLVCVWRPDMRPEIERVLA